MQMYRDKKIRVCDKTQFFWKLKNVLLLDDKTVHTNLFLKKAKLLNIKNTHKYTTT